jgi:hypothetical protein
MAESVFDSLELLRRRSLADAMLMRVKFSWIFGVHSDPGLGSQSQCVDLSDVDVGLE